uniref:non-specific serine/threonine protein kinase n=1 Tax=Anopheles farauti TaxID=69004 RepID=A0A182QW22_9DIPT
MSGTGETNSSQPGDVKRLSRRNKKKATSTEQQQQKQHQQSKTTVGPSGTIGNDQLHYDSYPPSGAGGGPGGSKRYQSNRSQPTTQRRERTSKLTIAGGASVTGDASHELDVDPGDMRISKLLRRLTGELPVRTFLMVCKQLEPLILDASNAAYVRKSFDILANAISTIQAEVRGHRECMERVAQLFGMMLYVMVSGSSDGGTALRTWVSQHLNHAKRIQHTALVALRQMIWLDRGVRRLSDGVINWLLKYLQDILESTDVPNVFMLLTDVMGVLADSYPDAFADHFTDIVDIVIGWQLDASQRTPLKLHCARILLAFRVHWCEQRKVTLNLLEQLSEDIDRLEYGSAAVDEEQSGEVDQPFGALLTAFNSVLKCVLDPECLLHQEEQRRLQRCTETIWNVVFQMLGAESPIGSGLLVASICECAMLQPPSEEQQLRQLIKSLVAAATDYTDEQVGALLHLLLHYLDEHRALFLLPILFKQGPFYALRYRKNRAVLSALHLLYHRLLMLKNVQVLQEAYDYLITDLDDCLGKLWARRKDKGRSANVLPQLQYCVQFNLLILTPLAMARNAIFITWTLMKRPVLHVLLEQCRWDKRRLTELHHTILQLAYHHSAANNHFISSSALLQPVTRSFSTGRTTLPAEPDTPRESPTADHFGLVLRFLTNILGRWMDSTIGTVRMRQCEKRVRSQLLLLLLDWCVAIVIQATGYHAALLGCDDFQRLLVKICAVAVEVGGENESIGTRCADCLDAACQYMSLHPSAYQAIAETCCVHSCSVHDSLRMRYTALFSKLPLRHSLRQVNEFTGVNRRRWEQIAELKNGLYQGSAGCSPHQSATLRMADLLHLISRIVFTRDKSAYVGGYLQELFTRSLNQASRYGAAVASRDLRCLIPWAQWEAAQLCVNQKLRTQFGKPKDTFLRIESIVKEYARVLDLSDQFTVRNVRTSMANQRHARILLGFLEALEKSIYNAAEGTAYALPPPEKPARTFFRVNHATCAEWFSRIRTSVDLVALHCMEPEMVIRYSEAVLRELVAAGKTTDLIFEHTVMSLVWALLRNWESDALYGVYVWCKRLTGRKYSWIRMAAEEAAGHRETAAFGFRAILADPGGMDRHIRDFIVDQTILSLLFTGDYRQLHEFLLAEESSGSPRATIPLITVTAAQIQSIIAYEETHDVNVIDISQWELIEVDTNVTNNFSSHKMICAVENSLSGILLQEQIVQRERMVDGCTELIQCYLQECLMTRCREYLFQLTITNHILSKITQRFRQVDACDVSSLNVEKQYGTLTLMRLLAWSEFMLVGAQQNTDLRLDLVSSGRKERNYALCRRELEKYYHKCGLAERLGCPSGPRLRLEEVAAAVTGSPSTVELWDENLARAVYEHCKWLYCQPGSRMDAIELAACATVGIDKRFQQMRLEGTDDGASGRFSERVARFLLTIGDWMASGETSAHELRSVLQLSQLLPTLTPVVEHTDLLFGAADRLVGTLLQGAAGRCPALAKAWFALGSWMYQWGKRIVEHSGAAAGKTSARFSAEQVRGSLAGANVSSATCERIVAILNEHEPCQVMPVTVVEDEGDELAVDSAATIGSIGLQEELQRAIPGLEQSVTQDQLHAVIELWRSKHRAMYGYYAEAAEAYFRFLQLSSGRANVEEGVDSERARSVTVTLRLLRLIVKHALGLKEVLEEGLATTPSEPWGVITPQLFSRLAHPEPYVRRRVSELLCRVAKDAPHLIIFPAVVGAVQDGPNEVVSSNANTQGLGFCFNALLEILSRDIPKTVQQVQMLVHELRRISLLWDQLWVVSLQNIYADYAKRIPMFESEYKRLLASGALDDPRRRSLLVEKHRLLLRPLLFVMEQLYKITAVQAETKHERNFQQHYHRTIQTILAMLRDPSSCTHPLEGWSQVLRLYESLQRNQPRLSEMLQLSDVSPKLHSCLSHTSIAMPGIDTTRAASRQPILIRSVDNGIQILASKTRPKKLTFCGNDGRRYGYLLKGQEDLHLDERVMQFLSIANLMMRKSIDCNGNVTHYRAEHYSVIPLGPRSGLITWVDNTVPIYMLYKKWQHREALKKKETKGDDGDAAVQRPSELFFNKLTPLLEKHGMNTSTNRREWPLSAQKQVLAELQLATPRDLLAKELWCTSATAASWRQVNRNYSISLAVMSVIGYIIGLGDRHLSNMLVKLATGEIVHIDYNMCFEKGKTLRIPERVPFRMTPNLEEALGVTGIEGTFRLTCEHVLKSLKKGRDTLLTLLEAFVYDPLVDWAIDEEIGVGLPMTAAGITVTTVAAASNAPGIVATRYISQAKKQLDREVTRDMLKVRLDEIRPDWQMNKGELLHHLLYLQRMLPDLQKVRTELDESERLRASLSAQLQLIDEASILNTAFASHPLANLAQRLKMRADLQEEYVNQREQLEREAEKLRQQLAQYEDYLRWAGDGTHRVEQLRTALLDGVSMLNQPDDVGLVLSSDPGYVKYCEARTELTQLLERAAPSVELTLTLLAQYGEQKRSVHPLHPLMLYCGWYERLADTEQQPTEALETAQSIKCEHAEMNKKESRSRIVEANRAFMEMERALVDGGGNVAEQLPHLVALVKFKLSKCTYSGAPQEGLTRVLATYEALERFHASISLAPVFRPPNQTSTDDRTGELNEQYEQLVRNAEHGLRTDAANDTVREDVATARALAESWSKLLTERKQPTADSIVMRELDDLLRTESAPLGEEMKMWQQSGNEQLDKELTQGIWQTEQTKELTECLLLVAKLQFLYEMTSMASCSSAPIDRFIRRFLRLRLAGRACLAEDYLLHTMEPTVDDRWLEQLTDSVQTLATMQPALQIAFEQQQHRMGTVRNWLAWTTAAYPPLCPPELAPAFEQSSATFAEVTGSLLHAIHVTLPHAQSVLRYERTRHHDLSHLAAEFTSTLKRWQKTLTSNTHRVPFISPTEEALVELLDPEGATDHTWISNVRALLEDMNDQLLSKIDKLEREERQLQTLLLAAVKRLNRFGSTLENIVGDIRALLRTQQRITGSLSLTSYLQHYRNFFDLLRNVPKAALTSHSADSDTTPGSSEPETATETPNATTTVTPQRLPLERVCNMLEELVTLLPVVFDQLFQFSESPHHLETHGEVTEQPTVDVDEAVGYFQELNLSATATGFSEQSDTNVLPPIKAKQQEQQPQGQKRNTYAVSVWRRIRSKLDGHDPNPSRRCSEQEQVAWMINEATDPANLALMYEGWTPWV